jgi:transcription antitermination factor NusG
LERREKVPPADSLLFFERTKPQAMPINGCESSLVMNGLVAGTVAPRPWYALQTKARHEKTVSNYLRQQGVEEFLPLYKSRREWSDRVRVVELPLFGGYIFCRVDPNSLVSVLNAPGVMRVLSYGTEPAPVPDGEIAAIRRLLESDLPVLPCPFLKVGATVRIRSGAMKGLEGRFERIKNHCRLVLSVNLLQRSVALEVDPESVEVVCQVAAPGEVVPKG